MTRVSFLAQVRRSDDRRQMSSQQRDEQVLLLLQELQQEVEPVQTMLQEDVGGRSQLLLRPVRV